MLGNGAKSISTTPILMAVVWLAACFATGNAYCDNQKKIFAKKPLPSIDERIRLEIECSDRSTGNGFCSFQTDMHYSRFLNTPFTAHDTLSSLESEHEQRRADMLMVMKLAVEQFNFLSGARLYWELTEQNIEKWAIKLRLKGEIPVYKSGFNPDGHLQTLDRKHVGVRTRRSANHDGLMSLFLPDRIKWNLGMDPNDGTLFGVLSLNSYMTLNGQLGDTNQVGLYFKYAF